MRHLRSGSKLGRQPAHRRATLRNLVTNLIEKERIETTILRAKACRPLAERMITLGKRDSLHARRQAAAFLMTPTATQKAVQRFGSALCQPSRWLYANHSHGLANRRRRRTRHHRVHRLGAEEKRKEVPKSQGRRSPRGKRRKGSCRQQIALAKAKPERPVLLARTGLFYLYAGQHRRPKNCCPPKKMLPQKKSDLDEMSTSPKNRGEECRRWRILVVKVVGG